MESGDSDFDQELIDGFISDAVEIIEKLKFNLREFTISPDQKLFESFGQEIDRIMGAALTLGFRTTGELAKLGKDIGYKASQISEIDKLLVLQSVLSQLVKELDKELKRIKKSESLNQEETKNLVAKFQDVNQNLGNLRTSVKI